MGLRDMYSAISGLEASSTWLDVIGNNISNANTIAYKASRVEFAAQISQTLYGGTGDNPNVGLGGVDPEQVGLGTKVASITTLFTEGSLQQTGISTDIAIVGNGFLVSKSGDQTYLTRAGNLTFDSNGNLVDQNGGLIQGLTASIQYTTKDIGIGQGVAGVNGGNLNITSAKLGFASNSAAAAEDINIPRDATEPPNATTVVNFTGNLDSFLQATDAQHGGVLNIGGAGVNPTLPIGMGVALNPAVANIIAGVPAGQDIQQVADANTGVAINPDPNALGNDPTAVNANFWTAPIISDANPAEDLTAIQLAFEAGDTSFVWDNQPPEPPAQQVVENVFDSEGNPRQITVNFYQVNDLGDGGINNPSGPNQVMYAWYAFDTTDGKTTTTPNLIGGSGIVEGSVNAPQAGYNRGTNLASFYGDLLAFNTDGSLLTTGGAENNGFAAMPDVYLPPYNIPGNPPAALPVPGNNGPAAPASPLPTQGAQITQITLNFGEAGILGEGRRNGVYSDAEGSYQVVNGVNTYVPQSTAYASSQDGFAEGVLQSVQFDATGTIQGTFSNGQTTAIGQVVIAMPNNQDGLISDGNNYYSASANSGAMFVGFAGQDGVGTVQGDTLELSNVDLSVELTNMIIAQRGFETDARVISVESANMQTLTQLGQGG